MSREILFRGKRIDNGGWVYGVPFFIESEEKAFIINNCSTLYFDKNTSFKGAKIDFETIGQYTGLKDKNGVKVFEGDYLHMPGYHCEVVFTDGGFRTVYKHPEDGEILPILDLDLSYMKVIGNIHDK